jgi:hypothetical protein
MLNPSWDASQRRRKIRILRFCFMVFLTYLNYEFMVIQGFSNLFRFMLKVLFFPKKFQTFLLPQCKNSRKEKENSSVNIELSLFVNVVTHP